MGTVSEELHVRWGQAGDVPVSIIFGNRDFGLSKSVDGAWALADGVRFKLDSNVNIHSVVDIYPGGTKYNFNASYIDLSFTPLISNERRLRPMEKPA